MTVKQIRFRIATCQLAQATLNLKQNTQNILQSIYYAVEQNAMYRFGPDLELTGSDLGDHFLEQDTYILCLHYLYQIQKKTENLNIIIDLGMPYMHEGNVYNCRVIIFKGNIKIISPKNKPEHSCRHLHPCYKYFKNWYGDQLKIEILFNGEVKFGCVDLELECFVPGKYTAAQLFISNSDYTPIACENSSCGYERNQYKSTDLILDGSLFAYEMTSFNHRSNQIKMFVDKYNTRPGSSGVAVVTSTFVGSDGGCRFYEGGAFICADRGEIKAACPRFSFKPVEIAVFDLESKYFTCASDNFLKIACTLSDNSKALPEASEDEINSILCLKSSWKEEIVNACSFWLWDFLKKSKAIGFVLPLSGGIDSSLTFALVVAMCDKLWKQFDLVKDDICSILRISKELHCTVFQSKYDLINLLLHTLYLQTKNSSKESLANAEELAHKFSAYHTTVCFDSVLKAMVDLVKSSFSGLAPKFTLNGGTNAEDLALQNVQARLRMVIAYFFAGLIPGYRQRPYLLEPENDQFLLVLGTGNVDECDTGYFTKYDNSSADINLIGTLSKKQIFEIFDWICDQYDISRKILHQAPNAELRPKQCNDLGSNNSETDEDMLQMTYENLHELGEIRKLKAYGPVLSMVSFISEKATGYDLEFEENIRKLVNRFYHLYARNSHKMSIMTPSLHLTARDSERSYYNPRPLIYPTELPYTEFIDYLNTGNFLLFDKTEKTKQLTNYLKQKLFCFTNKLLKKDDEKID